MLIEGINCVSLFVDLSLGVVLVPFSNEKRAGKGNAYEALGKKSELYFRRKQYDLWSVVYFSSIHTEAVNCW